MLGFPKWDPGRFIWMLVIKFFIFFKLAETKPLFDKKWKFFYLKCVNHLPDDVGLFSKSRNQIL